MKIKKIAALCLVFTLLFTTTAYGGTGKKWGKQGSTETEQSISNRPSMFQKMLLALPFAGAIYGLYDNFYLVKDLLTSQKGLRYDTADGFDRTQAAVQGLSKEREDLLKGYEQFVCFGFLNNMDMGLVIICSMDKETGEISLLSLPPDFRVKDSTGPKTALKDAYETEGITKAVWAINNELKLNLSDVIVFDEHAIINAVNAIGGVEITLSSREFMYINSYVTQVVESAQVVSTRIENQSTYLDGVQLTAYLRFLYAVRANLWAMDDLAVPPQDTVDTYILSDTREGTLKAITQGMEKASASLLNTVKNADLFAYMELARTVIPQINCSFGDGSVSSLKEKFEGFYLGDIKILPQSQLTGLGTTKPEEEDSEPVESELVELEEIDRFLFSRE